jgi:hypothetical protein
LSLVHIFRYFAETRELVDLRERAAIVMFLFMRFAPDQLLPKSRVVGNVFSPLPSVHNKHQQVHA